MIHRIEWWQLCLPLAIGASLLPLKSAGRAALAGLVPALLGAAALTLRPAGSPSYVAASIGLMLAGGTLPLGAAAGAVRSLPDGSRPLLPGALLIGAGTVAIAIRAAPFAAVTGLVPMLAWAAGTTAGWWTLVLAGRLARLRAGVTWLDRVALARTPPAAVGSVPPRSRAGATLLIIGALLVLAGPPTAIVFGGMLLASLGAELTFRRGARRRVPVLPLVTLALVPAYLLLHAIAGPLGLAAGTLDQVPLSPAAARLLALPLGLVAWAWMGLWPLHGAVRPVLLAPVGAAFWLRVAAPTAAEGLAHWQPLFVALAVAGLWHAAAVGRLGSVFVALAFAALASLGQRPAAALLLLGAAFTFELPRPNNRPTDVLFDALRRLGLAASAVGAMLAFAAGLRAEVVFTVLAAAGLAYGYLTALPPDEP